MYCKIKCNVQGKQARVKMQICVTRPQCVNCQHLFPVKRKMFLYAQYVPLFILHVLLSISFQLHSVLRIV